MTTLSTGYIIFDGTNHNKGDDMKTRICAYCKKEFIPNSSRQIYCKGPHFMTCPVCGHEYQVTNNDKLKSPPAACSYKCRTVRRTETSLQKYGCIAPGNNPEARKKASSTMMKNLGVPYAMMSKDVRKKSEETLLEKYGVTNVGQNEEIKKKRMETDRNNHGGKLAFNTPESYEHRRKTVYERYGCEVFAYPEFQQKARETEMKKLNASSLEQLSLLRGNRISQINRNFNDKLKALGLNTILELPLRGRSFDIGIPDKHIVIEINPSYTHNVLGLNVWNAIRDKSYHIDKTQRANNEGYRCIHIWDWDDWNKILNMLKPRNKIHARKCKIFKLYDSVAKEFISLHHLQGSCRNQLIYFGLVYEDQLVQVMTFGRPRYDKSYNIELLRLCTDSNYEVIGGASKLFTFAMKYIEPESVISYCDISKFTGDVYVKIGMNLVRQTPPQEIWSKENRFITANLLRQHGYDQLFHTHRQGSTSNEQLMLENGWLPVYDCGQYVYEWRS